MSRIADIAARIEIVALPLGPYRNLTTILASILASHPQCAVLNHAAERMLQMPGNDFFADGDLDTFLAAGLPECEGGQRGKHGGDIRLSHAFEDEKVAELYARHNGDTVLTDRTRCLFWKDSMRFTVHMRSLGITPSELAARDPRFRFVLPIRNPLDCAQSSLRFKYKFLTDKKQPTKLDLAESIIEVMRWITANSDRLFVFTEAEVGEGWLRDLCGFLNLEADPAWMADVLGTLTIRSNYEHSAEDRAVYREMVERHFADDASLRDRLLGFA